MLSWQNSEALGAWFVELLEKPHGPWPLVPEDGVPVAAQVVDHLKQDVRAQGGAPTNPLGHAQLGKREGGRDCRENDGDPHEEEKHHQAVVCHPVGDCIIRQLVHALRKHRRSFLDCALFVSATSVEIGEYQRVPQKLSVVCVYTSLKSNASKLLLIFLTSTVYGL